MGTSTREEMFISQYLRGGAMPPVPDWKHYTVGSHTPELEYTQRMLKSMGLKDPWLRNEVWRYDRRNPNVVAAFEEEGLDRNTFVGGLKGSGTGLALACISAGI